MKVPLPAGILPAEELGRVHFVGIGGAGLSGIARIMLARGVAVSGSDAHDSSTLAALRALGARVDVGHDRHHLGDADVVVVSTAVREDNPEVVEARRRGIEVWPRSAALRAVMLGRRVVAVAGTHGKTTTTSLLTMALQAAGADPTYAIGGDLVATGVNAGTGVGDLLVAEADESDGAFLTYRPHVAVVTNVGADHLDHWLTEAAYADAFAVFVEGVPDDGFVVCCADDPGALRVAASAAAAGRRVVSAGESADADVRAVDVVFAGATSSFTLLDAADELGRVTLRIPGRHYVLDATLALATGLRLGYGFDALRAGVEAYAGTRRRMERKGEAGGVVVYDSYAHHPTEIAADLAAARAVAGDGRVVVAFQPHLVSRTRHFGAEMGRALGAADEVVVCDVYLAREEADAAVTGQLVAGAVPLPPDRVAFLPDLADIAAALVERTAPGDLVLTLGAGSVTAVGPQVLDLLQADVDA